MSKKYLFYTKWNRQDLICACLKSNPCCDKYRDCEELDLTLETFSDINECMHERSYKRVKGYIRQK